MGKLLEKDDVVRIKSGAYYGWFGRVYFVPEYSLNCDIDLYRTEEDAWNKIDRRKKGHYIAQSRLEKIVTEKFLVVGQNTYSEFESVEEAEDLLNHTSDPKILRVFKAKELLTTRKTVTRIKIIDPA